MKKEVKAIIAVVLAVWILVMGIEIGSIREKKKAVSTNNTTTTAESTTAPTTTEPTTTAAPVTTTQPSTAAPAVPGTSAPAADNTTTAPAAPSADPSTMSKDEIVSKVSEAVNKVKSEQNMTARKTENIVVNLTKLSAEGLREPVNSIISSIVGEPVDETITVSNGIATYPNGSTKPIKEAIPPSNDATKDFALTADGVASATAVKQGEDTVYTVVLVSESTTAANPIPKHNSVAIGYLNLMGLDLPSGVNITDSQMQYPGSTVEVTVNAVGQVTKLVNKMPMTGYGAAKIAFVSGDANFEGSLDEVWTFTY